jgi:hypothetical protein
VKIIFEWHALNILFSNFVSLIRWLISQDRVRLGPLGMPDTIWPTVATMDDDGK